MDNEFKAYDQWAKQKGYDKIDANLVFYKVAEILLSSIESRLILKLDFIASDEWDIGYKEGVESTLQYIRDLKSKSDRSA